jgi:hypothetical protein
VKTGSVPVFPNLDKKPDQTGPQSTRNDGVMAILGLVEGDGKQIPKYGYPPVT